MVPQFDNPYVEIKWVGGWNGVGAYLGTMGSDWIF